MITPDYIKHAIEAGLACDEVVVDGDGQHFQARIVSSAFEGLSRIKRHQLVYGALGDRMPISARLIVNPASLKLKRDSIQPVLDVIRTAVTAEAAHG